MKRKGFGRGASTADSLNPSQGGTSHSWLSQQQRQSCEYGGLGVAEVENKGDGRDIAGTNTKVVTLTSVDGI